MARLSSKKIEQHVLGGLLVSPTHMKALAIPVNAFALDEHKDAFRLIQAFIKEYKSVPSYDTIKDYANRKIENSTDADAIVAAIQVIKKLPITAPEEMNFYISELENFAVGRDLYDVHNIIGSDLSKHDTNFLELRKDLMKRLMATGFKQGTARRGKIYENAKERWEKNREISSGKSLDTINFGIGVLDDVLKGMKRTFLTLLYAKTGGGKTTLALNIAYNAARAGHNVLYISLEMDYDLLASRVDSLMAQVDSQKIIFGGLDSTEKKAFKNALKEQIRDKLNFYISDIPNSADISRIFGEFEMYRTSEGVLPDLTVIDSANLMNVPGARDRSTHYDILFKGLHEAARSYNTAMITILHESREATLNDIKKEQDNKKGAVVEGVHNIGASNYAANHCENVIRVKQSELDRLRNMAWAVVDKCRYGAIGEKLPMFSAWDLSYIGDKVRKQNVKVVMDNS